MSFSNFLQLRLSLTVSPSVTRRHLTRALMRRLPLNCSSSSSYAALSSCRTHLRDSNRPNVVTHKGLRTPVPGHRRFSSSSGTGSGRPDGPRYTWVDTLMPIATLFTLGAAVFIFNRGRNRIANLVIEQEQALENQRKNSEEYLRKKAELQSLSRSNLAASQDDATNPLLATTTTTASLSDSCSSVRDQLKTAEDGTESPPDVSSDDVSSPGTLIPVDDDEDFNPADHPSIQYIDPNKAQFPTNVSYLIIGAGTAGLAAAKAIRASDPASQILMIGAEEAAVMEEESPVAYLRPPLSKELWRRSGEKHDLLLESDGDIRRHSWLFYEADNFYLKPEELATAEFGGVALLKDDPVVSLDPDRHTATLKSGRSITYKSCLLSTGGSPKHIDSSIECCSTSGANLVESGHLSYFRSLADYKRLRKLRDDLASRKDRSTIAVLGGGFLGSELSLGLLPTTTTTAGVGSKAMEDKKQQQQLTIVHVLRESAPLGHVLPPCLASAVGRFEASRGVEVKASTQLVSMALLEEDVDTAAAPTISDPAEIGSKGSTVGRRPMLAVAGDEKKKEQGAGQRRLRLRLRSGEGSEASVVEMDVDHVVCAVGIEPNTQLASSAGLEVDPSNGGFLVNAELESRSNIYAAGDAASYWDPVIGSRRRVEHLNFAEETGELAGRNMAACVASSSSLPDTRERYHFQSSLWSSLGRQLGWDAVGWVDSRKLVTRTFYFADDEGGAVKDVPDPVLGQLSRAVTFYLTPNSRRLVGVLFWNLPEDYFSDPETKSMVAPSRLNVARQLLVERRTSSVSDEDLKGLARRFDLGGSLMQEYAEVKAYAEGKRKEQEEAGSTEAN